METPKASFRLDAKVLKMMDKLIAFPPEICVDGKRGAARNRTELIEVLVKKAIEQLEAEQREQHG